MDYRPDTDLAQQFFATVQNKMHWATHDHTAAEVIAQRADATQPHMGLQTTRPGGIIRKDDVTIAKNYLTADELQVLNRIVTLYIEYAELQALERRPMTMRDWITKLDDFLKISGRQLLDHPGTLTAGEARSVQRTLRHQQENTAPVPKHLNTVNGYSINWMKCATKMPSPAARQRSMIFLNPS
ncbi:MAG: virulence RhuM family protein [Prosthecobacter sp.]|nr:virulence RhuM family protein [Prosthecobacter sp.]